MYDTISAPSSSSLLSPSPSSSVPVVSPPSPFVAREGNQQQQLATAAAPRSALSAGSVGASGSHADPESRRPAVGVTSLYDNSSPHPPFCSASWARHGSSAASGSVGAPPQGWREGGAPRVSGQVDHGGGFPHGGRCDGSVHGGFEFHHHLNQPTTRNGRRASDPWRSFSLPAAAGAFSSSSSGGGMAGPRATTEGPNELGGLDGYSTELLQQQRQQRLHMSAFSEEYHQHGQQQQQQPPLSSRGWKPLEGWPGSPLPEEEEEEEERARSAHHDSELPPGSLASDEFGGVL